MTPAAQYVFGAFVVLGLRGIAPPQLIAFGLVDLAGAIGTHLSLRKGAVAAAA